MEHWAYGTDDDETHEDDCTRAYAQKLQNQFLAQSSAGSSSGGSTTPCAVTNAPGDPSWWQLIPDPEKAQPLPRTYQHKQPAGCLCWYVRGSGCAFSGSGISCHHDGSPGAFVTAHGVVEPPLLLPALDCARNWFCSFCAYARVQSSSCVSSSSVP